MTTWSKTNVPARIALDIEGWVLVDSAGARIDWPAFTSAENARRELVKFRNELADLYAAEQSEAFGLSRMTGIDTE